MFYKIDPLFKFTVYWIVLLAQLCNHHCNVNLKHYHFRQKLHTLQKLFSRLRSSLKQRGKQTRDYQPPQLSSFQPKSHGQKQYCVRALFVFQGHHFVPGQEVPQSRRGSKQVDASHLACLLPVPVPVPRTEAAQYQGTIISSRSPFWTQVKRPHKTCIAPTHFFTSSQLTVNIQRHPNSTQCTDKKHPQLQKS